MWKPPRSGIPRDFWNSLQRGDTVTTDDGITYTPDMVLGEERKGIKLTYSTDSRPTDSIVRNAAGSDTEDWAGARNVQKLNHENLPVRKHDIVQSVSL